MRFPWFRRKTADADGRLFYKGCVVEIVDSSLPSENGRRAVVLSVEDHGAAKLAIEVIRLHGTRVRLFKEPPHA